MQGAPGAAAAANNAGMPGMPGGGMPGMPGGGGGGADDKTTSDFSNPYKAVMSFLNAVKAKDMDRIAEATAQRAGRPEETSAHYQKVFQAILEQSLAPEDLDELAKKFEGMKIAGQNQAKSTGRLGIIIAKSAGNSGQQQGDIYTRTITVRKEKAGWKVVDISGQREFEKPIMIRGMPGMRGGRRR